MDEIEILGLTAAFLTTVANIPQTIKIIRTRSTKSISAFTYSLLFAGMLLWVVYGICKKDLPIILANGIAALLCGIILVIKLIAIATHNDKD